MALHLRPKCRSLPKPALIRFFSTSRDPTSDPPEGSSPSSQPSQSQSSISDYLNDVKSKLKQAQQFRRPNTPFSASNQSPPSKAASSEEISKNLAEFRRRYAVPSLPDSPSSQNVIRKGVESERETGPTRPVSHLSFDSIRKSLKQIMNNTNPRGGGFSLEELNERLGKLREMEEKETESRIGGIGFEDLRDCLQTLSMAGDDKAKKQASERFDILGRMSQTADFMLQPPKEHLVEQYFHPDNMSSEEKMKLELAKIREEFKMSESDCGSARVQVAQLTTKIKHLSSVLHKKDKHSRKGLQEMVQRRKKLLKYLRRTDWDSYCLVLSRFGLRDNPDFKH